MEFDFTNCLKIEYLPLFCFRDNYVVYSIKFASDSKIAYFDQGAFCHCYKLQNLTFPSNCLKVYDCAMDYGAVFDSCQEMSSVIFPEDSKLEYIGELAFFYCISLSELILPKTINYIGYSIFFKTTNYRQITIFSSDVTIKPNAFNQSEFTNQIKIYVVSEQIRNRVLSSTPLLNPFNVIIMNNYCTDYKPSYELNITDNVLYSIKYICDDIITIPASVVKISSNCAVEQNGKIIFEENSQLQVLEREAFRNSYISLFDFTNCLQLQNISVWCFRYSKYMKSLIFPNNGNIQYFDQGALAECETLPSIAFPDTLLRTADSAMSYGAVFHKCSNLVSVFISANSKLEYLGALTFYMCDNLNHVILPASLKIINRAIFDQCILYREITILSESCTFANNAFVQKSMTDKIKFYVRNQIMLDNLAKSTSTISKNNIIILNKPISCDCSVYSRLTSFPIYVFILM